MPPADLAERHRSQQQRTASAAEAQGVRLWRQVDHAAIAQSWSRLVPDMAAVLSAAQLAAASRSDDYTTSVLRELNVDVDPAGEVVPRSLAGLSADGRSLASLLFTPVVHARSMLGRGEPIARAMASGQASLRLILRTEVADAARVADGVAVAARPSIGYVRHVSPPSCPRCAILAGRTYRFSQGFQRHPGCDCYMVPAPKTMAGTLETDPRQLFEQGQIRGLSQADAKAIADGADMNRVINAHRGMYTADHARKFTHALAGRRGIPRLRLRPETIYREATSRADAVRLLRLHGYLS